MGTLVGAGSIPRGVDVDGSKCTLGSFADLEFRVHFVSQIEGNMTSLIYRRSQVLWLIALFVTHALTRYVNLQQKHSLFRVSR